jgi:5-(carboxyamino)imidazole ribonucleotide synthase
MRPIFTNHRNYKLGVLGGGQLGKMLAQAAADWHIRFSAMDKDNAPAKHYVTDFVVGDFRNKEDVLAFGKSLDMLTIEIESVNLEALHELKAAGIEIHPDPDALSIICDKGLQKSFFVKNYIPTSDFVLVERAEEIVPKVKQLGWSGFVQKLRKGGYDGRGVQVVKEPISETALMNQPSVLEPVIDIHKELSVIAARNKNGDIAVFPPVEMVFHPTANLVEFLQCPASIEPGVEKEAKELAKATIAAFDICGLLAVEMFLDRNGDLLVNEVAPRPHNSGHHTIEGHYTSQFQQHLRGILNMPLGNTDAIQPSIMINVLGEPENEGQARYYGVEHVMKTQGAYLHLYGKEITKPYRKMGHITITGPDLETIRKQARKLQLAIRAGI